MFLKQLYYANGLFWKVCPSSEQINLSTPPKPSPEYLGKLLCFLPNEYKSLHESILSDTYWHYTGGEFTLDAGNKHLTTFHATGDEEKSYIHWVNNSISWFHKSFAAILGLSLSSIDALLQPMSCREEFSWLIITIDRIWYQAGILFRWSHQRVSGCPWV